ncbi:MAG TPA: hypothetical protein VFT94_00570, partial [Gaiellaceae bacterium]|nr:hypothetical protein [Gaiellaceae bacterium]
MIDRDAKEILESEAERLRRILAGLDDPRQELEAAIAALAAGDVRGFQEHTVVGMTILDEMGRVSAGLYDRIPTISALGERVTHEEMDASIEHAHR